MTQFTLWGNYASETPNTLLLPLQHNATLKHQRSVPVTLNDWLYIWNRKHDDYYTCTPQERGVLLCYKCDTLNPPPCCAWQVQWVDVFWILSRGTGQGITPSDPKHCPLLTPKMPAFCLKHCWWQVPLTSLWSHGAAIMANRVPTTDYTGLIPTNHFTPINNTGNLSLEEVFISMAAKIYLIITNKLKSKFIIWPIRKVGRVSHIMRMLIWPDFR